MPSSTRDRLLTYLQRRRSASAAALARHLGISAPALYKHLAKLLEEGRIKKRGTPPRVQYLLETRSAQVRWDVQRYAGKAWYHQRFDGAPQFISMIGEAETLREPRKPAGTEARWRLCVFAPGVADWYLDQEDIARGAAAIVALAQRSATVSRDVMASWADDEAAFEATFARFPSSTLADLGDIELLEAYEEYHRRSIARFTSSSIIDHFALGTDERLAEMLRTELAPDATPRDFNALFSIATAPVHLSFINEAESELLAIGSRVQRGEPMSAPEVQAALARHQARYYWSSNNYVKAQVLSVEHFEQEITSWLQSGRDLAAMRAQILRTPRENARRKRELLRGSGASTLLRRMITISEDFTRWQDERKRATYLCIHMGSALLAEMGRRRGAELELLKYLLPAEVEPWFLRGSVSTDALTMRRSGCAVVWEEGAERAFTGSERNAVEAVIAPAGATADVRDIRGLVACTGKAIGRARIVLSVEEISKVRPGDILIAVMTRPDYVPAMRRAAAIVTNEGGVTCHAAIVSRELGVPCIIGTKVATRVFSDGDLLEVNANHNWVRKLEG